jgi:hypothetical protein
VITDQLAGDLSALPGGVIFSGSIGGWTLIVTTGTTKPLNGTATAAEMHLNVSGTSTSAVATTLNVRFSEDFFGPITNGTFRVDTSGTIDASAGGATNTVTESALFGAANTPFVGAALVTSQVYGPGASSTNQTSGLQTAASYSLTNSIVLTHAAGTGRSSSAAVDIVQNVPDGGFTLSLLGSAMVGLAALRRKFAA